MSDLLITILGGVDLGVGLERQSWIYILVGVVLLTRFFAVRRALRGPPRDVRRYTMPTEVAEQALEQAEQAWMEHCTRQTAEGNGHPQHAPRAS